MTQATVQNAQQKINDLISENTALREKMKELEGELKFAQDLLKEVTEAALKEGGE